LLLRLQFASRTRIPTRTTDAVLACDTDVRYENVRYCAMKIVRYEDCAL
jgi:hypothetical protein